MLELTGIGAFAFLFYIFFGGEGKMQNSQVLSVT